MLVLYLNISVTRNIVENYEKLLRSVYGNVEISVMSPEVFSYEDVNVGRLNDEQIIKVYKLQTGCEAGDTNVNENFTRFTDIKKCIKYGWINIKTGDVNGFTDKSAVISEKFAEEHN
jgi:hypothetical protein